MNGVPEYPEPSKGYLEQDADLMLAFEALEEIQETRRKLEETRERVRQEAMNLFAGQ